MSQKYFENKVVWITGASSGIGEELTHQIAEIQANVKLVLSARNLASLEKVARESELSANQYLLLPLDVSDFEAIKKAYTKVEGHFGGVDILINNAGVSQRSLAAETSISVDQQLINVNYLGSVAMIKSVLPNMIKKKSGHIINISSIAGIVATPLRSSYAAAKHAIIGFSDALRAEVFKENITVTVICPGYIKTNISLNALTKNGKPQGSMDKATENGISVEECAKKIIKSILNKEDQTFIAGTKEMSSVYLKRFAPRLLRQLIRKIKTV